MANNASNRCTSSSVLPDPAGALNDERAFQFDRSLARARRSAMSASSASALIGISIQHRSRPRHRFVSIIAAAERPSLAAEGAIFAGATGQFTLDRRDMSDAALPFVDQIANPLARR